MSRSELTIIGLLLAVGFVARVWLFLGNQSQYTDGQVVSLQVQLRVEPELSNKGQQFAIQTPDNHDIYVKTSAGAAYHYGDILAIRGSLQVQKNEKGHEFLHLNLPQIEKKKGLTNPMTEASVAVRRKSAALFESTLPPIASSLLLGIVFGAKEDFPDGFKDNLRSTGVLHVIAASGMNVSFFTGAVMFSLGMFLTRRIAILCSVFAVIFYSFLVGFEPSIVRASVMAIIAFAASFLGKQRSGIWALFVTGYLMVAWFPGFLFDVGFQLSFMATLGILLLNPRLSFLSKFGALSDDIKTTVSAEVATLPILLSTFGQIGVWSFVVNTLVLWTVPILMLLGSVAVLFGFIIPPVGSLLLYLSLPFLLYFESVVRFFGGFGWNLSVDSFPWPLIVGYYLLLGVGLFCTRKDESMNRHSERNEVKLKNLSL